MRVLLFACFGAVLASQAAAQECLEPLKPEPNYLRDAGYSRDEIHAEFRRYFTDVEAFLGCMNRTTSRVHDETRQAAYALDSFLRANPPTRGGSDVEARPDGFVESTVELLESGRLILNFDAGRAAD